MLPVLAVLGLGLEHTADHEPCDLLPEHLAGILVKVGSATGPVTVIYNGRDYKGSPRDVPLAAHAQIQVEVARPLVSPVKITCPTGL